jgi:hypothetical protein
MQQTYFSPFVEKCKEVFKKSLPQYILAKDFQKQKKRGYPLFLP